MIWETDKPIRLEVDGVGLEARCYGPPPSESPTIVMLHEGLGCVALMRDFPQKVADATGHGVFVYSRQGYGQSDPVSLPRPLDYMTREAVDVLPKVLDQIGFRAGVLLGHSDGASIAALYLGNIQDHRVRGLILMAPHFFTEPSGLASIAEAKVAYETGDLKPRLAKYHADVEGAFRGWNDAWLDPGFKEWNIEYAIDYVRVPVLAIQGADDKYGTLAQLDALEKLYAPFDRVVLNDCGHAPHLEQGDKTLAEIVEYMARLDRIEAAEPEVA
ncbi:alpha/beta fold hydrolase [Amorphus orientalis]|uniref:Pimeloyl-ACP methyl ester carboxylesterase n=1 Tax=Amorphus orientalis TaxID=649198 RepID=A0AAE4ATM6_9HYPH|nr:alpha/beta fold hydrolase [Amorphus orientalis]MDQ0316468.1 pimeloyl-ACP methyl ester carboxylesterase [Amorphus orientalis]